MIIICQAQHYDFGEVLSMYLNLLSTRIGRMLIAKLKRKVLKGVPVRVEF